MASVCAVVVLLQDIVEEEYYLVVDSVYAHFGLAAC